MDLREQVVRMGGGWNWLRIVSMVEFGICSVESSYSTTRALVFISLNINHTKNVSTKFCSPQLVS